MGGCHSEGKLTIVVRATAPITLILCTEVVPSEQFWLTREPIDRFTSPRASGTVVTCGNVLFQDARRAARENRVLLPWTREGDVSFGTHTTNTARGAQRAQETLQCQITRTCSEIAPDVIIQEAHRQGMPWQKDIVGSLRSRIGIHPVLKPDSPSRDQSRAPSIVKVCITNYSPIPLTHFNSMMCLK